MDLTKFKDPIKYRDLDLDWDNIPEASESEIKEIELELENIHEPLRSNLESDWDIIPDHEETPYSKPIEITERSLKNGKSGLHITTKEILVYKKVFHKKYIMDSRSGKITFRHHTAIAKLIVGPGSRILRPKKNLNSRNPRLIHDKIRVDKALVADIVPDKRENIGIGWYSEYDPNFQYKLGQTVISDSFNDNILESCASGIHAFMTYKEAVNY